MNEPDLDLGLTLVGKWLSILRQYKGLTQSELATRSGVDPKTIWNLESGRRWPQAKNRHAIEEALTLPSNLLLSIRELVGKDAIKYGPRVQMGGSIESVIRFFENATDDHPHSTTYEITHTSEKKLSAASDAELLAEVAKRMARPIPKAVPMSNQSPPRSKESPDPIPEDVDPETLGLAAYNVIPESVKIQEA